MTDRIDVKVAGVILGSASGWDQADDMALAFYDFTPSHEGQVRGMKPASSVFVNPWTGDASGWPDNEESPDWTIRLSLQ